MDRFSRSLSGEGFKPSLVYLEEQREANKKDIVRNYITNYIDDKGRLPEAEDILETFWKVDLDADMVKDQILFHKKHYGACN